MMLWTQSVSPGVRYRVSGVALQSLAGDFGPFETIEAGMPLFGLKLVTVYEMTVQAIGASGQLSAPVNVRFTTTAGVAPVASIPLARVVCAGQLVQGSVRGVATDADQDIERYNLVSQSMPSGFVLTEGGVNAGAYSFTVPTLLKVTSFKFSWVAKDSQSHLSSTVTSTFKIGTMLLGRCS